MSSLNPPLNKDDFLNSSWQEVINGCSQKECLEYHIAFWNKSKEVENVREKTVFETLVVVTNPIIVREQTETNFQNLFQNIREESLIFLADIVSDISDAELQARVADILWVKRYPQKGYYKMAQLAIDAYLQSAKEREMLKDPIMCSDFDKIPRLKRALELSISLGDSGRKQNIIAYINTIFNNPNFQNSKALFIKLMEVLQEFAVDDAKKYANFCETYAQLEENKNEWDDAKSYWEIKAKWHQIDRDKTSQINALMSKAETWVKKAEATLNINNIAVYTTSSELLKEAIKHFKYIRALEGISESQKQTVENRITEINKMLISYQEKISSEFLTFPIYMDSSDSRNIDEAVKMVQGQVSHKSIKDAVLLLSTLCKSPSIDGIKESANDQQEEFLEHNSFPANMINNMGKTVAKQPVNEEDKIRFKMYRYATSLHQGFALYLIEPARQQIILEHENVTIEDILLIIASSSFVPPNRRYLFAKGLYAGLRGDFITSTHILIPQIENAIRYLLSQKGVITSKYDDQGIQDEYDLNQLLFPSNFPEIREIFDEDTLFDLQGLLIERAGSNLRNRMAHGLIDDHEFDGAIMCYLWWLTLRLCLLPMLNNQEPIKQDDTIEQFAGIFADDPLFDDFVEDMAAYRQEIDDQVANADHNLEEK